MDMFLYIFVIPIIVYFIARRLSAYYHLQGNKVLLLAACVLFGVSVILPSPIIHGQDTEFWTHFFGGGVFTGLLWLYFKPLFKSHHWFSDLIWLYVLTSALGVLNELYELFALEIHLNSHSLEDTSWDLAANTLGVLAFYGGYRGILFLKTLFFSR